MNGPRKTRRALYIMPVASALLVLVILLSYLSGSSTWSTTLAGTANLPGVGDSNFSGWCWFAVGHKLGSFTLGSSQIGDCYVSQYVRSNSGGDTGCEVFARVTEWKTAPGFTGFSDFFVTSATVVVSPSSATPLCLAVFFHGANPSSGAFTGSFDTGVPAAPGHNALKNVNGFTEFQSNVLLNS